MKSSAQPVSIRLDASLKRRAAAFARRRKVGLTTALRMIISEHLDAAESSQDLDTALRWQRDRAWAALERWEKGEREELSLEDIRSAHRKALRR
jgi:hypothetical protein